MFKPPSSQDAPNAANSALFFSLPHEFPTEWAACVSAGKEEKGVKPADFSATIRRDFFPYFTQGKRITVTGFEVYDKDATKLTSGNQQIELDGNRDFPLTIPNLRTGAEAFLIIRYAVSSP